MLKSLSRGDAELIASLAATVQGSRRGATLGGAAERIDALQEQARPLRAARAAPATHPCCAPSQSCTLSRSRLSVHMGPDFSCRCARGKDFVRVLGKPGRDAKVRV